MRHNRHRHYGTFYNADAHETKQLQTGCSKIYYGGSETGRCLHKLHNNVYNVSVLLHMFYNHLIYFRVGCVAQLVERRSLTGELSLSCARPAADG